MLKIFHETSIGISHKTQEFKKAIMACLSDDDYFLLLVACLKHVSAQNVKSNAMQMKYQ
jgi:hypothetical protein